MPTHITKITESSLKFLLGIKLRQLRTAQGLKIKELSEKSGVSMSYLTEIEKGKKYPKPDKITAIADALGVAYADLTSTELDRRLKPFATLLNSNILDELPLEHFGVDIGKLLEFFTAAPDKIGAFLQTLIDLVRLHEMDIHQFYFSSLRAYQELTNNYLEEVEVAAEAFLEDVETVKVDNLADRLTQKYGVTLDETLLTDYPELNDIRSVWLPHQDKKLALNPKLNTPQKTFILARELAFHELKLDPRPTTFSYVKPESFELILNNYKASYFAGAILLPRRQLVQDLNKLFAQDVWNESQFRALLSKYQASPEMLLHRLTSLAPKFLGLKSLFFLRFSDAKTENTFKITKELHLDRLHTPHANRQHEHYCRR
ncbi:MAG: helix-turn-helix domain-containing protein, partial [Bacteroidota bacterium]